MKDIELISPKSVHSISFVCSFGYKITGVVRKADRMNDRYTLKNLDTWREHAIMRKNFFSFIKRTHGGVEFTERKSRLDPIRDMYSKYKG